jgi:hypothetical protein
MTTRPNPDFKAFIPYPGRRALLTLAAVMFSVDAQAIEIMCICTKRLRHAGAAAKQE